MITLAITVQFICQATLVVGQWQAPAALYDVEWLHPQGCRLTYADAGTPGLLAWCAFLGPARCTATVTP